jgi:hypothetical protein
MKMKNLSQLIMIATLSMSTFTLAGCGSDNQSGTNWNSLMGRSCSTSTGICIDFTTDNAANAPESYCTSLQSTGYPSSTVLQSNCISTGLVGNCQAVINGSYYLYHYYAPYTHTTAQDHCTNISGSVTFYTKE